jgi:lysine 2,3-aminomutase
MPSYMLDIPGGFGKVPLESDHLEKTAGGWQVRDMAGVWHAYQDCLASE